VLGGDIDVRGQTAADRRGTVVEAAPELAALLVAIAERDDSALAQLYDCTASRLYGLARAMLGNAADAEEVVCDVYVQVWQTATSFDHKRGSVLAWMLMICRSRSLDLLRQRRSRPEGNGNGLSEEEQAEEAGPEDMLSQFQQGTAVYAALQKLTPLRRRLVSLAFFQGLSHQEIATATQLPVGTVKSHLRRSLLSLRAELDR